MKKNIERILKTIKREYVGDVFYIEENRVFTDFCFIELKEEKPLEDEVKNIFKKHRVFESLKKFIDFTKGEYISLKDKKEVTEIDFSKKARILLDENTGETFLVNEKIFKSLGKISQISIIDKKLVKIESKDFVFYIFILLKAK